MGWKKAKKAPKSDRYQVLNHEGGGDPGENREGMVPRGENEYGDRGFIRQLSQEDENKGGEEKLEVQAVLEKSVEHGHSLMGLGIIRNLLGFLYNVCFSM
jgi:hypothetical protein